MSSRTRPLFLAVLAILFLSLLTLAGCGGEQPPAKRTEERAADQSDSGAEGTELYTPEYQPTGEEVAVMKTSKGDITIRLFGKDAPINVGNFVELAEKGFYDKTKFHRFEPGFVIQGGDPQTKEFTAEKVAEIIGKQKTGDFDPNGPLFGTGGPGYTIKGEFDPAANPNKHGLGVLAMARSQSPDSAGSQFYFTLQPQPQLDGGYTVFGVITEGLDVMQQLRIGDEIQSIEIRGAAK